MSVRAGGGGALRARRSGSGSRAAAGSITAVVVFLALLLVVDAVNVAPLSYFDRELPRQWRRAARDRRVWRDPGHPRRRLRPVCGRRAVPRQRGVGGEHEPDESGGVDRSVDAGGVGVGMAVGAFNGLFIAFLRLQPIVVTLSTMFIVQGVTLLVMEKPGGFVSPSLGSFYLGDADAEPAADADRASRGARRLLAMAEKHAVRNRDLRRRKRRRRSGRDGRPRHAGALWRLRARGRLLRAWRRLHQRADGLRRPAGGQLRCCCRSSPRSWSAEPALAAVAAARSARSSAPTS